MNIGRNRLKSQSLNNIYHSELKIKIPLSYLRGGILIWLNHFLSFYVQDLNSRLIGPLDIFRYNTKNMKNNQDG